MAQYLSVEEARHRPGLKLVATAHVPGLWSEAAKNLFDAKKIPYLLVAQEVGGENRALRKWTAQTSAPVIIWNDERPRSSWLEQLYLAERLKPEPVLIPADLDDRVTMFGLCNELLSENGFGWNMRLASFHYVITNPNADPNSKSLSERLAGKYDYDAAKVDAARAQMAAIVARLRDQFARQREQGSRFLIGDSLSALDVYWAAIAGAIDPLPPDLCPGMPEPMRQGYTRPELKALGGEALFRHRDFIYRTHLKLPMDF